MSEIHIPPEIFSSNALVRTMDEYKNKYQRSLDNPEAFWAEEAEQFFWFDKWETVRQFNYDVRNGSISIEWFKGGKTNITVNCIDRHLETRGEQTAILWEGNQPGENRTLSYNQLYAEVCRFSNVLKKRGVRKGDRVSIYMSMVPELAIAMLACARIGAIHSIVFGGFSSTALADRITDSSCTFLITTDGSFRGKKSIPVKVNADEAIKLAAKKGVEVKTSIV